MEVRVELDAATFMDSPAVKWAMTFKRKATVCDTLQDLANGVFLNEFMADIDPTNFARSLRQIRDPMSMAADDCGRHNLNLLLEGITNYYQDVLQAVLILELPIVNAIVRDPTGDAGLQALQQFLMLMIGVAVQCEGRERHINQIKSMSSSDQIDMMTLIQQVMDGMLRIPFETLEECEHDEVVEYCRTALENLNQAVAVRDNYAQQLDQTTETLQLLRTEQQEADARGAGNSETSPSHVLKAHHSDQLRELKSQLRILSDELEQKSIANEEMMAQEAQQRQQVNTLNSKLRQHMMAVEELRTLRDELDVWKAKAENNERNQQELRRCREKLEDYEYTRSKAAELNNQNALLQQQNLEFREAQRSIDQLTKQVSNSNRDNRALTIQVKELTTMQDGQYAKIKDLNSEKVQLEGQVLQLKREVESAQWELKLQKESVAATSMADAGFGRGSEEYVRVETENAELKAKMEEMSVFSGEVSRIQAEYESQTAQLRTVESEAEGLRAEVERHIQREADLEKYVEETKDRLQQVEGLGEEYVKGMKKAFSAETAKMMALESQLDTTLHKSVELKEERIRVLEDRLQDALTENNQLKDDVGLYKKHNDLLRKSASQQPLVVVNSPQGGRRNFASALRQTASAGSPLKIVPARQALSKNESSETDDVEVLLAENAQLRREVEILSQSSREAMQASQANLSAALSEASLSSATSTSSNTPAAAAAAAAAEKLAKLEERNSALSADRKALKKRVDALEKERAKLKEKDVSLSERVTILAKFRSSLEQENKTLMTQLNKLLLQNQELLFKTMTSKERFMSTEAQYQDTVEALQREKDQLSEELSLKQRGKKKSISHMFRKKVGGGKGKKDGKAGKPAAVAEESDNTPSSTPTGTPEAQRREAMEPMAERLAIPATPLNRGLDISYSPMSQRVGLEQMLMEGRIAAAQDGLSRTPSHPPAQSVLEHDKQQASSPQAPSRSGQTVLDFLLNERQQVDRGKAVTPRPRHTNGENTKLQQRRRNNRMSGASRRGPRAKSLLSTESSTTGSNLAKSAASAKAKAKGADQSSENLRQLRELSSTYNGAAPTSASGKDKGQPRDTKDTPQQEDGDWMEYGCV